MNIRSLEREYTKFDVNLDLFDLTTPSFIWRDDIALYSYVVKKEFDMRVDLIMQDIYDLDPILANEHLSDIDVICYINNIDNFLNIREGMVLLVPALDNINEFRYNLDSLEESKLSVRDKLIVPNKSTKVDPKRKKYVEDGYSLPPVVKDNPEPPVKINNGKFSVGGI